MVQDHADTICLTGIMIRGTSGPRQMSLPNPGEVAGEVFTACLAPRSSSKTATTTTWGAELRLFPSHFTSLLGIPVDARTLWELKLLSHSCILQNC